MAEQDDRADVGMKAEQSRVGACPETLSLHDLGLRPYLYHVLSLHQISLSRLVEMTAEDVMRFEGVGESGARHIDLCLRRFGFGLRPSVAKAKPDRRLAAERRGAAFAERWFAGETLDRIAKSAGISRERVRQLIWMADPGAVKKKREMRRAARTHGQDRSE